MAVLVGSTIARAQFDGDLSGVEWTPELSAPVVIGASGCDKNILRVSLSGGIPGNEYVVFDNSMLPGSSRFQLQAIENGATVTVTVDRGGRSDVWKGVCPWNPCTVSMPVSMGAMEEGDLVNVTQRLCPGTDSTDALFQVRACGDVPAPTLASPPRVGDTAIQLASYAPKSEITVFVSQNSNPQVGLTAVGHAAASATINLFRPLDARDRWIVIAQTSPACSVLTNGSGYGVLRE